MECQADCYSSAPRTGKRCDRLRLLIESVLPGRRTRGWFRSARAGPDVEPVVGGPFEGPDSADLDEDARERLAKAAIPVPEAVATGDVRMTDERRYGVPVVLVCPEFSPDQARAWLAAGDLPELARAADVACVDIDSGHWPMLTRPAELARILADAA
jgi:pimeloyl-ACP methyl ester carboxylesterase